LKPIGRIMGPIKKAQPNPEGKFTKDFIKITSFIDFLFLLRGVLFVSTGHSWKEGKFWPGLHCPSASNAKERGVDGPRINHYEFIFLLFSLP